MRLNINTSDVCIVDTLNLNWNNNYNTTSLFRDGGKAIRLSKKGSKQKIKIKESNKGLFTKGKRFRGYDEEKLWYIK